jgi:hypothetical protein
MAYMLKKKSSTAKRVTTRRGVLTSSHSGAVTAGGLKKGDFVKTKSGWKSKAKRAAALKRWKKNPVIRNPQSAHFGRRLRDVFREQRAPSF